MANIGYRKWLRIQRYNEQQQQYLFTWQPYTNLLVQAVGKGKLHKQLDRGCRVKCGTDDRPN